MKEITLALPFYNTSKYFKQAIELSLNNEFVKEIVVNDDASSEAEWEKLNEIVNTLNTDKIKLFRNEENLGGFRNKYTAVKNSTCEWVYLLDSDNHPAENTLDVIESIQDPNPDFCYIPQKLMVYDDTGYYDEVIYNFKYEYVGLDEAQDALLKKTKYIDWFLNTGNFVFNRERYLERLESGFNDKSEPAYACSIAFSYHWMRNGGFYKVVPGMEYHHLVRRDSYWHTCGDNSMASALYYHQRIIDLV